MNFDTKNSTLKKTIFVIGIVLFVVIYKLFNPNQYFFPKCPVHLITGLYCPGCGSQRSLHAFLNFHILEAFSTNLLVGLLITATIFDILFYFLKLEKLRPVNFLKTNRYISIVVLYLVIVFTILRNIPFYPFNILAPWKFFIHLSLLMCK